MSYFTTKIGLKKVLLSTIYNLSLIYIVPAVSTKFVLKGVGFKLDQTNKAEVIPA